MLLELVDVDDIQLLTATNHELVEVQWITKNVGILWHHKLSSHLVGESISRRLPAGRSASRRTREHNRLGVARGSTHHLFVSLVDVIVYEVAVLLQLTFSADQVNVLHGERLDSRRLNRDKVHVVGVVSGVL